MKPLPLLHLTLLFMFLSLSTSLRTHIFRGRISSARKRLYTDPSPASPHMTPVRVRFAPSPTGNLHVGGARTALFNWLLARKTGGKFIVRVEDTDIARSTLTSERAILEDLAWLGLDWDEGPGVGGKYGPYRQSERKEIYVKYAKKLVEDGYAYPCFSTEEELQEKKKEMIDAGAISRYDGKWRDADKEEVQKRLARGDPHCIRFRIPEAKVVYVDDVIRGRVRWDAEAALGGDFIIMRSNGMPMYNFCVAVDDVLMRITHVLRAEEHLSNTLKQLLVMEALRVPPPRYAHCSLILGEDGSKLSKRHGATSVGQFREEGYFPECMLKYLSSLGFYIEGGVENATTQQLIDSFRVEKINRAGSIFDIKKLKWMQLQYTKSLPLSEIESRAERALTTGDTPLLRSPPSDPKEKEHFEVCKRRMIELIAEINKKSPCLIGEMRQSLLSMADYNLEETIRNNYTNGLYNTVHSDNFIPIMSRVCEAYKSNQFPHMWTTPDPRTCGIDASSYYSEKFSQCISSIGKDMKVKGKKLYLPIRVALAGEAAGPELHYYPEVLDLAKVVLAKNIPFVPIEERIARVEKYIESKKL